MRCPSWRWTVISHPLQWRMEILLKTGSLWYEYVFLDQCCPNVALWFAVLHNVFLFSHRIAEYKIKDGLEDWLSGSSSWIFTACIESHLSSSSNRGLSLIFDKSICIIVWVFSEILWKKGKERESQCVPLIFRFHCLIPTEGRKHQKGVKRRYSKYYEKFTFLCSIKTLRMKNYLVINPASLGNSYLLLLRIIIHIKHPLMANLSINKF